MWRTDCDRRESLEGATPVCALVRNDIRISKTIQKTNREQLLGCSL